MADTKLSALPTVSSVVAADLIYTVTDVATTPASKRITFDNVQKSITVLGGSGGVTAGGNINLPTANYLYFGAENADGSWRFYVSTTSLMVERRESGTWNPKGEFTA